MIPEKPPLDELVHFGVKGMQWGVRKDRAPGVPSSINRQARKDAHEFARAKMFYGKGAGTRRKLIKAKVETNSRHSAHYKTAFDHHLARQNLADHAAKAQSERRRKNVGGTTKRTAGAVARRVTGEFGTAAAFVALSAAGAAYLNSPAGKAAFTAAKAVTVRKGAKFLNELGVTVS